MKETDKVDEVTLTAFVDNQLDAANREAVIKAMDEDESVRQHVYELRKAKDLIKLSFSEATPSKTCPKNFMRPLRNRCLARVAAAFIIFTVGLSAGVTGHNYYNNENHLSVANLTSLTQQQDENIILHIDESDPHQFEITLAYTEQFLKKHKKNGKARIEVVANAGGIDLLREDFPLNKKVMGMMDDYDNITFIACTNAINKLRSQGINPAMIKDVQTDTAALTHIINRLSTGWTYIKADSEMLKI